MLELECTSRPSRFIMGRREGACLSYGLRMTEVEVLALL